MSGTLNQQIQKNIDTDVLELDSKRNWYVFYTAPRAEKAIQKELYFRGYEIFLPMTKTLRIWKNRQKKMVDQVLFPGYIFVKTEVNYLYKICQISKIMAYIHCGGEPSIISSKCIEGIKRMLNLDRELTVEYEFIVGDKVKIIYGPLAGYQGILIKKNSKTRFGIQLEKINHTVLIDICMNEIEKL